MKNDRGLEFFRSSSPMTEPGRFKVLFEALPDDVPALAHIIHGLILYDVVAADFYGFAVPADRMAEIHIRSIEKRLHRLIELDDRPLDVARPVDRRILGRCQQFVLLMVAVLREKGTPARARCGFGAYFNMPRYEDHWVCERWIEVERRWMLADPQFDDVWCERLGIKHDVLDVPRTQFLVAADAWEQCRRGELDPDRFGISFAGLHGLWYIAGSLVRDLAALNKMEMLPWDVWGAQPRSGQQLSEEQLAFYDELARLTRDPDATFVELRRRYEADPHLHVPSTVYNALLQAQQDITGEIP
jgi:Transglutaminase-like superfamily